MSKQRVLNDNISQHFVNFERVILRRSFNTYLYYLDIFYS